MHHYDMDKYSSNINIYDMIHISLYHISYVLCRRHIIHVVHILYMHIYGKIFYECDRNIFTRKKKKREEVNWGTRACVTQI